jgi:hypothetical protein
MARIAVLLVGLMLAAGASAQTPAGGADAAEDYARARMRDDKPADFNEKCGGTPDPHVRTGWDNDCRQISHQFLENLLTRPQSADQIPQHGVHLIGAYINGTLDLTDAEISPQLWVEASRIEGSVFLTDSRWKRPLVLQGSTVAGGIYAERMRSESALLLLDDCDVIGAADLAGAKIDGALAMEDSRFGAVNQDSVNVGGSLYMRRSAFEGGVVIRGAKVGGNLEMDASYVGKTVDLGGLNVGGNLFMRGSAEFDGGVNLVGARIGSNLEMDSSLFVGAVVLNDIDVGGSLFMRDRATFADKVDLGAAKIGVNLEMGTSSFVKAVNLSRLTVGGNLLMNKSAKFGGEVNLVGAKIGSDLEMESSLFVGAVNLDTIDVGGLLFMRDRATFADKVDLIAAKIGSNLEMGTSSFAKSVNLNRLTVGGHLFMNQSAKFGGEINLVGAKIGSNLEMQSSSFAGQVLLDSLDVTGGILMRDGAKFENKVDLSNARIGINLRMDYSAFMSEVIAEAVRVGNGLFARGATFHEPLTLIASKIGGILDLRDATAFRINLTDADAGELLLSNLGWHCPGAGATGGTAAELVRNASATVKRWPLDKPLRQSTGCGEAVETSPALSLRNARVGEFQDSPDAWPLMLDLEGFHYDRLGGLGGIEKWGIENRSADEWKDWLARAQGPSFSTQPYAELSSVLAAAGRRDTADAIDFARREQERDEALNHHDRTYAGWLWFLSAVGGYGIGHYIWRVGWWVGGLTVVGFVVLRFSANAKRHGPVWMIGASLHRLLPVVSLYKEFDDFFDNARTDDPRNLAPWQVFYFAVHAVFGWGLGLILLAAMSGLTQKG